MGTSLWEELPETPLGCRTGVKMETLPGIMPSINQGGKLSMERQIPTTCTLDCPCRCSILVTVKDGEIVSHTADPGNPYTRSFLCSKGNDYVKRYASPNRLLTPMVRKADSFVPISWDEALDLAADKLSRTRKEFGPLSTLWTQYSGSQSLLNLAVIPRVFFIHLGGSTMTAGGVSVDALQAAQNHDFGACLPHSGNDLLNSKNIVIWGRNPAVSHTHLIPFIKDARKKGAKLTVIDPRYSETAELADRHIAPRPGGDGYLAIAVAREVHRRQGKDPDYVTAWGNGWEDYKALLNRYSDAELIQKADVTDEDIRYLADAYWEGRPCATYPGLGVNWYKNGGANSRLIHSLIFMSGNVGIPGGGANFFFMEFPFGLQVFREEMARARERGVALVKPRKILLPQLGMELEQSQDPPVKLAWIAMFNPVATAPDSNRLRKALRKLDYVIVTEQFMTATAQCADLVLPVTTYLEEDDVVHSHGDYYIGPVNAAVPPRGESRSNLWIFQQLAQRMGFGDALKGTPWDWIARCWAPLTAQGITLEQARQGVTWLKYPDVPYQNGAFRTQDGKFPFITQYDDRPEPTPGLTLLAVKTASLLNSQLLPEDATDIPRVRLNPATMSEKGIKDGDRVVIQSALDSIEVKAEASPKTRRDVAEILPSQWKADGGGVNRLREAVLSDLGPTAAVNEAKVELSKS